MPVEDDILGEAIPVVFRDGPETGDSAAALARTVRDVSFVADAHDDDISTARVRRHLDVTVPFGLAKAISQLCEGDHPAKRVFESRLSGNCEAQCIAEARVLLFDGLLDPTLFLYFWTSLTAFIEVIRDGNRYSSESYEWNDTAVGNILLVGSAVMEGSFQAATDSIVTQLNIPVRLVLSSDQLVPAGIEAEGRLSPSGRETGGW
jgi:2-phospho-L-lactate transferase/gluconeogenesis factor (CofD/UPF0052 family)